MHYSFKKDMESQKDKHLLKVLLVLRARNSQGLGPGFGSAL